MEKSLEGSFDFTKRKADPTPDEKEDTHGTRCAGEIAGKGNNGICGVGVAFGAKISGEKLIANITIDATEAAAFNFQNQLNHIYSASWGPNDDGETLDGPGVLGKKALKQGTVTGRDGLGSIFVFASGNGGKEGDNCNSDGYQNSIYTISIGAITASGVIPWYGEQCSAHLAVTYSGGEGLGVSTTDLDNGCSSKHSGTSAAAPIAAGIIALVLSVRNDLSWRDIQQLIVKTAKITDFKDSDWIKNGAGFHVSHKYGFGNLDATRMVEEALNHSTLPKESLQFEKHKFANRNIEYKELEGGFFDELIISKEEIENIGLVSLEHVQVTVKIMHEDRGHLKITLVSPAGTPSIVYNQRPKDHSSDGFDNWTFLTVRNWGENPIGKWVMKVEDFRLGSINTKTGLPNLPGHLYSWGIVLYGTCSKEDETSYVINSSFLGKSRIEKKCIHTVKIEEDGRQETIIGLIILMLFVIIGVSSYTFRKIFKSNFKYRLTPKEDIESPRKTSFKENFGRERNKESESDEEDSEYDDEIDEKKKKKTYKNNFTPKLLNLNISQLFTTNSNTSNRRLVNTKADEQENTSVPLISPVKQLIPEHKEFLMSNVGTGKTNSNLLVTGKEMESGNSEIAGEGEFSHTSALNKHFYANSPTLRRQNSAVRPLNSFNQEDGNRLEKEIKLVKVNSLQCLGDGLKGEVKRVNSTTGMHLKGISRSQSGSNLKNIKNN
ncbi:hypothetical protein HK099_000092 [Clydaea vesicula]|uniref:P/Homo B domain-containing protein n=1 Tax=Clydaea vesicula TaxID=447962 RepID=A0AAD5XSX6_9FUNG|nr:hypothetical protein HK099_000092 [Clydaea vesicula]